MIIAVSTKKGGLDDEVYPFLEKAKTFTIVKTEKKKIKESKVLKNPATSIRVGKAFIASQIMVNNKVKAVITGNCSPRTHKILYSSGIKIYLGAGNVEDTIKALLQGKLPEISTVGKAPKSGRGRSGLGPGKPPRDRPDLGGPFGGGGYL